MLLRSRSPAPSAAAVLPGSQGEHDLQDRYGTGGRARQFYERQVLDRLNEQMIAFVDTMQEVWIGTADAAGNCDVSLRAGRPGFVQVLDPRTLLYPEYRGNGVMASLGNIHENPHIGMLFLDLEIHLIGLHVNGHAQIVDHQHAGGVFSGAVDLRAERHVRVRIDEAYIQCRKHLPRMQRIPRDRPWGTDHVPSKGGDFFHAACETRPWGEGK